MPLEATDARDLTAALIPQAPELIVTDVSFIGLEKAQPAALGLAAEGCDLVALVKPQFEVGRGIVGKGGIVSDPLAQEVAVDRFAGFLQAAGWDVRARADSPIAGGDGNREILVWAQRTGRPPEGRRPGVGSTES